MNYDFPFFDTETKKFVKKHDKAISLIDKYDPSKTAIEQGYTGEYIRKELKSLKRDAEKIIKENVVYLCSDKKFRYFDSLHYLWVYANSAMIGLYRVAGALAIEDYTMRDSLKDILDSDIYDQIGRSTNIENGYGYRSRFWYYDDAIRFFSKDRCFGVELVKTIDDIYDTIAKTYDRILGENLTYTEEIIKAYSLPEQEGLTKDEIIPIHLKELSEDLGIQAYIRKAADKDLLLDQKNYKDLYLAAGLEGDYTLDKTLTEISDIIDTILSPENISKIRPRIIKMAITLGYGEGSSQ